MCVREREKRSQLAIKHQRTTLSILTLSKGKKTNTKRKKTRGGKNPTKPKALNDSRN